MKDVIESVLGQKAGTAGILGICILGTVHFVMMGATMGATNKDLADVSRYSRLSFEAMSATPPGAPNGWTAVMGGALVPKIDELGTEHEEILARIAKIEQSIRNLGVTD